MAGNRPDQSHGIRAESHDEKPVLNERFESFGPPVKSPAKKSLAETVLDGKAADDKHPRDTAEPDQSQSDELLNKGIRQFRLKHWEKALRELLMVIADDFSEEKRTELAYYLGLCCSKLERFDDAVLYLEQVVTAGGNPMRGYQCRMIIAFIYIKTGRAKMAEFELKRIEDSGFESALLYNAQAYAAYSQKRYLRAIALYEKALELEENNPTALNSLGFILADQGLDAVKGLRLCRKAVGLRPESAAYLDSLGWASFKCGRNMEANKWLRKARDIAPNEPEIKEHIKIVGREAM